MNQAPKQHALHDPPFLAIIPQACAPLSTEDLDHVKQVVSDQLKKYPDLTNKWFEREGVIKGWQQGPCLFLEDHRPIALISDETARSFQYRSLGLAGSKDFLAVAAPRNMPYERYMRDMLKFGAPHILAVERSTVREHHLLAKAIMETPALHDPLIAAARNAGSLTISPFIASGDVWMLARTLAKQSGAKIYLAGPPPALTRLAND
ncbi:MAG: hypothetical protein AAF723_05100, partial [Pseudomonadota bacterium]